MNNKTSFAAALLAAYALTYAGASSARDNDNNNSSQHSSWQQADNRHDDRQDDRHDGRDDRYDDHDNRRDDHHDNRGEDNKRYHADSYRRPKGYQSRQWDHGDSLPRSYRSSRYVINDYRRYNLYAPPRGQRWVRVDNDVVLVQISTGLINVRIGSLFY